MSVTNCWRRAERTREDHSGVSDQCYAAYAEGRDVRNLVAVVGEEALTDRDRRFLQFAEAFEKEFVVQDRDENRTIQETLDLGWKLMGILPREELKRIHDEYLDKYYKATSATGEEPPLLEEENVEATPAEDETAEEQAG